MKFFTAHNSGSTKLKLRTYRKHCIPLLVSFKSGLNKEIYNGKNNKYC